MRQKRKLAAKIKRKLLAKSRHIKCVNANKRSWGKFTIYCAASDDLEAAFDKKYWKKVPLNDRDIAF